MSVSESSLATPRMICAKKGSDASLVSVSGMTSAIASVRLVTRVRAARLGT